MMWWIPSIHEYRNNLCEEKSEKNKSRWKSRVMAYILNISACSCGSACKLVESTYAIVQRVNPFLPRRGQVHLSGVKRAARVTFVPFFISIVTTAATTWAHLRTPDTMKVKQMCGGEVIFSITSRALPRIKRRRGEWFLSRPRKDIHRKWNDESNSTFRGASTQRLQHFQPRRDKEVKDF